MNVRIFSVLLVLLSFTSCLKKQVEGVQVVDVATFETKL